MDARFPVRRLAIIAVLLLLSGTLMLILLRARIVILEVNSTLVHVSGTEGDLYLLFAIEVRSRANCSAQITLGNLTLPISLVERSGMVSIYAGKTIPPPTGNYSVAFRVSNGIWSVVKNLDLTIPSPTAQTSLVWNPVHYPISNRSAKGQIDVYVLVDGEDAGYLSEAILAMRYYGVARVVNMSRAAQSVWIGQVPITGLGPVRYHFQLTDSIGRSVRLPGVGDYEFQVKQQPFTATEYIASLRRYDGSFGPSGYEHVQGLWWMYHALESAEILGYQFESPVRVPGAGTDPEGILQRLRSVQLAGQVPTADSSQISALQSIARPWTPQDEVSGYFGPPMMSDIYNSIRALTILNLSVNSSDDLVSWVLARRNPDGGWGNVQSNMSHISFTFYALGILESLGVRYWDQGLADFVLRCRNADGAFGWTVGQPSDIRYTYHALAILGSAGVSLDGLASLTEWLLALQNQDGGFGSRVGMPSDVESSHLALSCLKQIDQLGSPLHAAGITSVSTEQKVPDNLGIYSAVLEGAGMTFGHAESPGYIVEYASQIGLDLLGLKTGDNSFVRRCRDYAESHGIKVDVVASEEQYGVSVSLDSIGAFSHVANIAGRSLVILPKDSGWESFRVLLTAFQKRGGLTTLQTSYSPEFSLIAIDDSMSWGGYGAVSFEDPAKAPWSERYWSVFPMVCSADAHYDVWRTRTRYDRDRTLFIASNGTWEGFKEAVELNRVVRVHIAAREQPKIVLFGSPAAVEYVNMKMEDWAWWLDGETFPEFFPHIITRGNALDADYRSPMDAHDLPAGGALVRVYNSTEILSLWIDGVQRTLDQVDGDDFWSSYLVASAENLRQGTHTLTVWWRQGQSVLKYEKQFDVT